MEAEEQHPTAQLQRPSEAHSLVLRSPLQSPSAFLRVTVLAEFGHQAGQCPKTWISEFLALGSSALGETAPARPARPARPRGGSCAAPEAAVLRSPLRRARQLRIAVGAE